MMDKKRINKKLVKANSPNFKIPNSFSELSFKSKIISIVLIALVIGVIGSVIPGDDITGMDIADTFSQLTDILGVTNNLILKVFGALFNIDINKGNNQIIYAMFVLFCIVVGIVYLVMRQFSNNPLVNFLVSGGIAYLSTFLIPRDVIIATGLLYSSTFMSIILVIPIVLLWAIVIKIDKTKIGYIIKCLLLTFMFLLMSTSDLSGAASGGEVGEIRAGTGILVTFTRWIVNVSIMAVIGYFIYAFYKIWVSTGKDIKKTEKKIQERLGIETKNTILSQLLKSLKKGKAE